MSCYMKSDPKSIFGILGYAYSLPPWKRKQILLDVRMHNNGDSIVTDPGFQLSTYAGISLHPFTDSADGSEHF